MRGAVSIVGEESALEIEQWASVWFGEAWAAAELGEREPERMLVLEVVGRASTRPSPQGLAAVAALRRVVAPAEWSMLDETVEILSESQPMPAWSAEPGFEPVRAWRAVDVWDSEHVLFVEYGGSAPHILMARVLFAGGVMVDKLAVLDTGAIDLWPTLHGEGEAPMPLAGHPVEEVLAEMADAMRTTDMYFPRHDDDDYVELRALAWSRCRSRLPGWPDHQPMTEAERERLLAEFAPEDDTVARSLAEMFLDYGDGYMTNGPLSWSPEWVGMFMTDWLPRKGILDADQRAELPDVLRRWIRFALTRRSVDAEWIDPVTEAVDQFMPAFAEAFEDTSAWGPAKQVVAELAARGIDMSDEDAVAQAVRGLNAENLARRLIGD
ncbi:hypothetical protein [Actinoplanes sp. NPDC026670]|uniref:hypothetical protein n=1 Tax=Actinoplanes sp. NPDC026670 TaxID=3154700 RepID=UPI0033E1A66B